METLNDIKLELQTPGVLDLQETLTILILLGEEEKYTLPPEVMIENVTIRSDSEIREELLNRAYDTVFITQDYVTMHGANVVKNIVKLFITLTTARVHYLRQLNATDEDETSLYLNSIGVGNITKIDVSQLTVSELRVLARENRAPKETVEDQSKARENNLILLQNELRNLPHNMVQDYVKKNKGSLVEVISSYLNSLQEVDLLKGKTERLTRQNVRLEEDVRQLSQQLKLMTERRDSLREDLQSLRKSVLTQKDKIDEYNERLIDSEVADEPKIILDEMSPTIIYFKEIEDIGFFNFYESILFTLSRVYKYYVKSIVLETSNRHFYDPYTELGYATIAKEASLGTVIENDKLVRYGNPTNLLKAVANPEFKTEIIMVYDRTLTDDILIDSPYLLPMYIGYNMDRIRTLDIEPIGWISPTEGSWKNIKPLLNHDRQKKEDRLAFNSHVSKHPLTNYIRGIVNI